MHLWAGTFKENSDDMVAKGRSIGPRGERAGNHVLTHDKVLAIKEALTLGTKTQSEIAREHDCGKSTVWAIRSNMSWNYTGELVPVNVPLAYRKYSDEDYAEMRRLWEIGWKLKQIAEKFGARVDVVQSIISGKRGKGVALKRPPSRQNQTKYDFDTRVLIYQRWLNGETQMQLAERFGMSKNGINNLVKEVSKL